MRHTLNKLHTLRIVDTGESFNTIKDLEEHIRDHYRMVGSIPEGDLYDKWRLEVKFTNDIGIVAPIFFGGLSRLDVGEGDYNPSCGYLRDHILGMYDKEEDKHLDFGEGILIPYDFSSIK